MDGTVSRSAGPEAGVPVGLRVWLLGTEAACMFICFWVRPGGWEPSCLATHSELPLLSSRPVA